MDDLLALFQCSLLKRENVSDILAVNGTTAQAGLVFSPGQAVALLKARGQALHDSGRLELKGGIVKKLILAFYDSPFFLKEQAVDTLEALLDVFYHLKNETFDSLGDDELIGFLRERFDGECQGSLERLRDEAFDGLARKIHGAAREDGSRENDRGEEAYE